MRKEISWIVYLIGKFPRFKIASLFGKIVNRNGF
jgi:hypothetical protein